MMEKTQTYKVLQEALLLVWDAAWADEYVENYKAHQKKLPAPHEHRYPVGPRVKPGQEIIVEFGESRVLLTDIGEHFRSICSLAVTVRIGTKTYTGITLVYNSVIPSIVMDNKALRPVKKRAKQ